MNNDNVKYFELAIMYFGSLPPELKLRLSLDVKHDPIKLIAVISDLADKIKTEIYREPQ